ncbi:hypothetical protein Tco_1034028 [Tanacetum coccineum]
MEGCTQDPSLDDGETQNTRALGTWRTPPGGTSAPAGTVREGLSPAFMKENNDVLRTMIKELENRVQEKVTPRRLFNRGSEGAGSENSHRSPSVEEVEGYSSDGSSRSMSQTHEVDQRLRVSNRSLGQGGPREGSQAQTQAEQEEWPMPVWCKMFRPTLSGSARKWFDSLEPKSVDGFEELSNKFLEEFS